MHKENSANHSDDIRKIELLLTLGDEIRFEDYKNAVKHYSAALEIAEILDDTVRSAEILNKKIGLLYFQNGEFLKGISWWEKAYHLYLQHNDEKGQCDLLNKLGVMHKNLSRYTIALEYYQKSLEISTRIGADLIAAKTLNNLGVLYKLLGNPKKAVHSYEKSLALKRGQNDKIGIANSLNNLGNAWKNQGENEKALTCLKESAERFTELTQESPTNKILLSGLAAATHDMGNIYYEQGHLQKALDQYKKSLDLNLRGGKLVSIFSEYRDLGEVNALLGNYTEAQEFLRQAHELAVKMDQESCLYQIHSSYGLLYAEQEKHWDAADHLAKSISILENMRTGLAAESHQTSFLFGVLCIYQRLIMTLLELDEKDRAFEVLEMMKARVLLDILESGQARFSDIMTTEELEIERELLAQLENLNQAIAGLRSVQQREFQQYSDMRRQKREQLDNFEELLYLNHPELREKRGRGEPLKYRAARRLMSRDETAVYYLPMPDELLIFLMSRDDMEVVRVPVSQVDLDVEVRELLKRTVNWNQALSESLYSKLISPIHPFISAYDRLCIIPDGILNYLPYQALQNPGSGRYLIEDFAVYYTPSLSALKSVRSIGNYGTSSLLAFGDPVFQHSAGDENIRDRILHLNALPETGKEVDAIGEVYGNKATILKGLEASKSNFRRLAGDYGVLHFATHAFTDEQNPMFSAIVLAKEEDGYGFLEAREILQMELNADLVILSACNTASGRVLAGEGMMGITRAFFTAGVPTVIASLWNVDDQSTQELMVQFHSRFRKRERPATALREAQLHLLKNTEFTTPFHWAPFVLIGDSE